MASLAMKAAVRRYQKTEKGRAAHRRQHKRYNATERGKRAARNRVLIRKYDITVVAWESLFAAQEYACASCGSDNPGHKKGWQTDHDHDLNKVRGILCYSCNTAAHRLLTPVRLRLLALYLEKHHVN